MADVMKELDKQLKDIDNLDVREIAKIMIKDIGMCNEGLLLILLQQIRDKLSTRNRNI